MKTPETQPIQNVLPVRFEYTGNYSKFLSLNEPILRQLVSIIGTTKTALVFKDGKESIERAGAIVKMTGSSLTGLEQTSDIKDLSSKNINEEKGEFEISINSQVIDGRIREILPRENYQKVFLQELERIILVRMTEWAFYEAQEKGLSNLFKNMRKKQQLEKFFLAQVDHILLKDSHDRLSKKRQN